jgi:hypothetical protein
MSDRPEWNAVFTPAEALRHLRMGVATKATN